MPTATDADSPSWMEPRERLAKALLRRKGCSMSSVLMMAARIEAKASAMRTPISSFSSAMGTRMRMGQCHRYSEYEMRPR